MSTSNQSICTSRIKYEFTAENVKEFKNNLEYSRKYVYKWNEYLKQRYQVFS